MEKVPFDIDVAMEKIEKAVQPFRQAAMFELYAAGYTSPFEQLLACMISIRTFDEVTIPTSMRLFARARTPTELLSLKVDEIDDLIQASSFHERKSGQMLEIARRVRDDFEGELPCDQAILLSLPGIGVKCANLVLGIACGQPRVSADVHVDRITNRWGYVQTTTPEKTSLALEEKLPVKYWVEINRLLVPFGKHICTGRQPQCRRCPVLEMCQQIGVTSKT